MILESVDNRKLLALLFLQIYVFLFLKRNHILCLRFNLITLF